MSRRFLENSTPQLLSALWKPNPMRPVLRKLVTLYLACSVVFSPIAPALTQGQSTSVNTEQHQLPELGGAAATPTHLVNPRDEHPPTPEWLSQIGTHEDFTPRALHTRTQGIEDAVAQSVGLLSGAASEASRNWFARHHITSELTLKAGQGGLRGGSLDLLMPFYNEGKNLLFVQSGFRYMDTYTEDYRSTVNLGLGYRRDVGDWLLGGNTFYDRDVTGKNDRLGFGVEAWRDFLKLSANSYLPLSTWQTSPDLTDYLERPAKGWDVRAEGYLPAYPQLGGTLTYEQYYGKEVSLFSASDRQKDPRALGVGVIYNPIPMVGFSVNHRMGQDGLADTSANLSFNYQLGVPLARQLSGDNVMASRLRENLRYDLVSRNNEIVLDHKRDVVQVSLPPHISDTEFKMLPFAITGAANLKSIGWTGTAADFTTPHDGSEQGSLQLPAYINDHHNTYHLQAVGTDKSGRVVTSNTMAVVVQAVDFSLVANPNSITADGVSSSTLSVKIVDAQNQARTAGVVVNWTTTAGVLSSDTSTTNSKGETSVVLTSPTTVGLATVEATANSTKRSTSVSFTAGAASAMNVVATPDVVVADGVSTSTLSATVKDAHGNLVGEGVSVDWTTGAGTLDRASSLTDTNGVATTVLKSPTASGRTTVQASSGNAKGSAAVAFVPGAPSTLTVSAAPATIVADGASNSVLSATIKDAQGNLVSDGVTVSWTTNAGTLDKTTSTTNASGVATTTLTSATLAGVALVEAKAQAAQGTANVTFAAGAPAVGSAGLALVASPAAIEADGRSTSTLTATVRDVHGNAVGAGVVVAWSTTDGGLASLTSQTNTSGVASTVLTSSTVAGAVVVEAKTGAAKDTATIAFTPGTPAPGNKGLALVATPDSIEANGSSTSTLKATIKDVNGNAVGAGVAVIWRTTGGKLASANSTTDDAGVASMVLTSSTLAGPVAVEAQAGAAKDSATVTFTAGAPAPGNKGLALVATPDSIEANGNSTSTLTARVRDANGNPAPNVTVAWSTTGGGLAGTTSTTDDSGATTMVLTSSTVAGAVTVEAKAGAASDTAAVTFTPGDPAAGNKGLELVATPASIEANGTSTSTLKATVKDANGNTVGAGVAVTWGTTGGALTGGTSMTNASGVASMVLTSSRVASAVTIDASTGAANTTTTVTFTPGAPATGNDGLELVATPTAIEANGSSTSTLKATVRDANGNLVGDGIVVDWTTTDGKLAGTTSATDKTGVASMVLTSSTVAGAVVVEAKAGAAHRSAAVTFIPGAPGAGNNGLTLAATPTSIEANGTSTSALTALVSDANGNAVGAGVEVTWSTTAGALANKNSTTDATGVARMVLTSSTLAGAVIVKAEAGAANDSTTVTFTAGVPAQGNKGLALVATPASIEANGTSTSTLNATVTDINGNPTPGVTVIWNTTGGALASNTSTTDDAGVASIVLTSATAAGTALVEAAAGAAKDSATVTFTPGAPASGTHGLELVATPTTIEANGTSTSTLRATLKDTHGNTLGAGVVVTWNTTGGGLADKSSITDKSGVATMVLTSSTVAGPVTVEATASAAQNSATVTFTAGTPGAGTQGLTVVATPSAIEANGTSTSTLKATVNDANGNSVGGGVVVAWRTTGGALASNTSTTDDSGAASVVLTSSTVAGEVTVEASAEAAKNTATVMFTAGAPAAGTDGLTLVATPAAIEADGKTTSSLMALVRDANGNEVGEGVVVTWSTTAGDLASTTSTTDKSGTASVLLTSSTVAGVATVNAAAGAANDSATVTFTAGAPAPGSNGLALVASPASIEANGSSTSTLTATVKDVNGNTVGAGIVVAWSTTGGTLTGDTSTTDNSGTASMVLTSSTMAGAVTVQAKNGAAQDSATVTFTAGLPAAGTDGLKLVATPASIEANGTSTSTLNATVKDANGNLVAAGVVVTWSTTAGALTSNTSTTDDSGVASMVLTSATVAGAGTVKAVAGAANDSATVTFVPGAPAPGVNGLELAATPASIEADGTSTSTLKATLKDSHGNALGSGVVVAWSTTGGALARDTSVTDKTGEATMVLTSSTVAGVFTIEASSGAAKNTTPVTFTAGVPAAGTDGLKLVATPASIEANGTSTSTLTATVKDANGNAVGKGVVVTWSTTAGGLASTSSTTDESGATSMVLTSSTVTGVATVKAAAGAASGSATVTFTPGAPAPGSNGLALVATPTSIEANGSSTSTLKATVKDLHGNTVGSGVVVAWSTTGGALVSGTSTTDNAGVASMVLTSSTSAGAVTVKAETGAAQDSATVTFTPGLPAAGTDGLKLVATPASIEANGSSTSTLKATVTDANGNVVGAGVKVAWTTSGGSLASDVSTTDDSGTASMVLTSSTVAGAVTAQAKAGAGQDSATVTFTPGLPAAGTDGLTLVATPDSIEANGTSTSTLKATLKDANGNPVGRGVVVTWGTSGGALASNTSTTDDSSVASVALTSSTVSGAVTVNAVAGAAKDSATVTFTPGNPAPGNSGLELVATPTSIEADGTSTSTLKASVKDAHGNPVGAGVQVAWNTTGGSLTRNTSTTDTAGVATMVLTSSTLAGVVTVKAETGAANNTATVTFTPGNPASGSSGLELVATPTTIEANGTSTSTLTALVRDVNGNEVGAGIDVTWSTTSGALAGKTSKTDEFGVANMVLTSATLVGTATIEASAGAAKNTATVTFAAGPPAADSQGLKLVVTPDSIEADGKSIANLVATLKDANGNAVGANVTVTWGTSGGTLASHTSLTDDKGIARMTLTSSAVAGAVTVEALSGAANDTATVTFTAGVPAAGNDGLELVATPASIEANGTSTSRLVATVKDANGNTVGIGVAVTWSTTGGALADKTSMTNSSGEASMVLTSSTVVGSVSVEAVASAARNTAVVAFTAGAPAPGKDGLELMATPDSIEANGSSTSTLTAALKDAAGNSVGEGVEVTWSTSGGTLANRTSPTDKSGTASMVLTSSTVAEAVSVTAQASAAFDTVKVTFTPGVPATGNNGLTLVATPDTVVADGVNASTLSATVKDANGNLVGAGVIVSWTSTVGALDTDSSSTNENGVATAVLTSPTSAAVATVEATTGAAHASAKVTFIKGSVAVVATPDQITANSRTKSTLVATVKDPYGKPVAAGTAVSWSTTGGSLADTTSLTDASGVARIVLTSSSVVGGVTVEASAGADSGQAIVNFIPYQIKVTFSTPTFPNSQSNLAAYAEVLDSEGQPGGQGETLVWTWAADVWTTPPFVTSGRNSSIDQYGKSAFSIQRANSGGGSATFTFTASAMNMRGSGSIWMQGRY
jgi:adhesin/invasin